MTQFARELQHSIAPNIFNLTIMPTEKCCCRCDYCYEDFAIGKMLSSVQEGIIALLRSRANTLQALTIGWFGGEPLMAKDVIYSLSKKITTLCREHSIQYIASMTTNAYLLDKACFQKLINLGVRDYQITLDGPEPIHDKIRKRVDGEGTFKVIMNNLKHIKTTDAECSIMLRLHYRPDTWESVLDLIDDLKRELLDDERFQVIFRPVGKWGGGNDKNLKVYENKTEQAWVEQQLIERLFGSIPVAETPKEFYVCYAAKANHLVIRANGNLAKCTVALSNPVNDIGSIDKDGKLHIKQERFRKWLIGFQTGDLKQLSCPASSALRSESLSDIPVVGLPHKVSIDSHTK